MYAFAFPVGASVASAHVAIGDHKIGQTHRHVPQLVEASGIVPMVSDVCVARTYALSGNNLVFRFACLPPQL